MKWDEIFGKLVDEEYLLCDVLGLGLWADVTLKSSTLQTSLPSRLHPISQPSQSCSISWTAYVLHPPFNLTLNSATPTIRLQRTATPPEILTPVKKLPYDSISTNVSTRQTAVTYKPSSGIITCLFSLHDEIHRLQVTISTSKYIFIIYAFYSHLWIHLFWRF
jgi:hypothetical protein